VRFSPSPARVAHVAVRYQGDGAQKALIALNRRASRRWSKRRRGSGRCEHHFQRHSRSLVGPGAQSRGGLCVEQSSRAEQRGSAHLQLAAPVVLSANYPSERVAAGLWSLSGGSARHALVPWTEEGAEQARGLLADWTTRPQHTLYLHTATATLSFLSIYPAIYPPLAVLCCAALCCAVLLPRPLPLIVLQWRVCPGAPGECMRHGAHCEARPSSAAGPGCDGLPKRGFLAHPARGAW
jgi:hypothetical protein